jgi:hypothetical protein
LGNISSAILWAWPYHVSCFCSISFIIVPYLFMFLIFFNFQMFIKEDYSKVIEAICNWNNNM